MIVCVLAIMLLLAAPQAASAAASQPAAAAPLHQGGGLQCANESSYFQDRGMTKSDYTIIRDVTSARMCCSACDANASCVAWTYHPKQHDCAIAPVANMIMGSDKISGSSVPPPGPTPLPPLPPPHPPAPNKVQPNIVLVLQDDMDLYMGAWDGRGTGSAGPMRQATELLAKNGAFSTNWFIHTPVCCPSRGEILSGKYLHNIRVGALADGGCMHVDEQKVNPVSFARYLEAAGEKTPFGGSHLYIKIHHFTKTGSGQTQGSTKKQTVFSQDTSLPGLEST